MDFLDRGGRTDGRNIQRHHLLREFKLDAVAEVQYSARSNSVFSLLLTEGCLLSIVPPYMQPVSSHSVFVIDLISSPSTTPCCPKISVTASIAFKWHFVVSVSLIDRGTTYRVSEFRRRNKTNKGWPTRATAFDGTYSEIQLTIRKSASYSILMAWLVSAVLSHSYW